MEMDSLPNGTAASPGPTLGSGPTAAGPPPSSKLSHLADSLKLEHQFLRVPFEYYKKTIRANHRVVEKEISAVINGVSEAADKNDMSSDDAVNHLSSLVSRLQGLKRKLEEGSKTEHLQAQRCRARLDHLESADVESLAEWNNTRVNRILVDYMLRMSYYDTAVKLAESRNIQDLVDIDVFQEAKKVTEALQNKDVGPALAWCAENKSRLKKSKLRLQEFIELVRAENNFIAITYARKYLAPWGTTHMKELQRVFVTVAYKSTTECATYKVLFEPKQWDYLVDQFKQEFCKLYGMTLEPLLNIYLQAGLSALKTPYCYDDDCTKEDPLSQEGFRKLALPLPYSKQHHSKLVCYITKELMDTENPPQVLPNGYVYSSKALEEMARKNDEVEGWRALNTNMLMNIFALLQYVPRVFRIYLSCKELKEGPDGEIALWVKGVFNFFLYILSSHTYMQSDAARVEARKHKIKIERKVEEKGPEVSLCLSENLIFIPETANDNVKSQIMRKVSG